jgi:hypothetical protein
MVDMKMEKREEPEEGVRLRIKRSPISGSGIARVHTSVLKMGDFEEGKAVEVSLEDRKRIMRLVADDRMDRGRISLRQKDMDKLNAEEGSEVILNPISGMGQRITKSLPFLRRKGE